MSKDYVIQLESTIANLRRDNETLKEELFKNRELVKGVRNLVDEWLDKKETDGDYYMNAIYEMFYEVVENEN